MQKLENILVLGDSLSKGVVLDEDKKRYTFLDDCFVNIVQNSIKSKLHNCAKFGSTVEYGRKILEKKLEKYQPDIVFVEFGGNDCDFLWDEIAKEPHRDHQPKTLLGTFEKTLSDIITTVKRAMSTPIVMTLPPLNAKSYFNHFTQGGKQKGEEILKWLDDIWRIYWWQERYSAMVKYVAEKLQIRCIDVRQAFLSKFDFADDFRNYICSDGIHPNANGHQVIANEILAFIKQNASHILCET